MSTYNTSFNIIIDEQVAKVANVQSAINLILETKHDNTVTNKLKAKFEELQDFTNKLMILKDALNYQVNLCSDIKNISVSLNNLVQQITHLGDDISFHEENENVSPSGKQSTNVQSKTSSTHFYSPAENNSYNGNEIKLQPTALNFNSLEIEPLTQDEFTVVPKYMVGRTTLDGINKFIDVVNKTLTVKYNILNRPKSSLKGQDLQQYRDYKSQEDRETKGKYFFTEGDLAKQLNKKNLEKSTYNLLVILRHTKRLSENRSSHFLRFIIN